MAVDPLLDAAILKASQKLTVLPYKIGKSAGLRQGNAVEVRGFPLGVMQAVSGGKVVNPYDRDQEQGWDHVDFVIDALLSEGNSGSPVLAASCKSRDLELVGVYHAGYKGHGALNVVVGIDQLTEFMHKKRRVPRALDRGRARRARRRPTARGVKEALGAGTLPLFDFGGLVRARRDRRRRRLLYHFYGRQFPLDDRRVAVIEDLPKDGAFGELGRLWVLGQTGWREWPPVGAGHRRARSAGARRRLRPPAGPAHASTTGTRWPTPARPTSAGAAASCRAPSPATSPSRATWPGTCSTRSTASRRRAIRAAPPGSSPAAPPAGAAAATPLRRPAAAIGRPLSDHHRRPPRSRLTRAQHLRPRATPALAVALADQRQDRVLGAVVAVAEPRLQASPASSARRRPRRAASARRRRSGDQQVLVDLADLLLALVEERLAQLGDRAREDLLVVGLLPRVVDRPGADPADHLAPELVAPRR